MAENQGTQKQSDWQGNEEMNIKENSSVPDSPVGNENTGESSWRPTDNEGELKEPTKEPTGSAGQSPAQPTGKAEAESEDF